MLLNIELSRFRFLVIFLIGLLLSWTSWAHDDYSMRMLAGARSAVYHFSYEDTPSCTLSKDLDVTLAPIADRLTLLGLNKIDAADIPDISILMLVEAKDFLVETDKKVCGTFVKIQAIHSANGIVRYKLEPEVLRILIHQEFSYGVSNPDLVDKHVHITASTLLSRFLNIFIQSNR